MNDYLSLFLILSGILTLIIGGIVGLMYLIYTYGLLALVLGVVIGMPMCIVLALFVADRLE